MAEYVTIESCEAKRADMEARLWKHSAKHQDTLHEKVDKIMQKMAINDTLTDIIHWMLKETKELAESKVSVTLFMWLLGWLVTVMIVISGFFFKAHIDTMEQLVNFRYLEEERHLTE